MFDVEKNNKNITPRKVPSKKNVNRENLKILVIVITVFIVVFLLFYMFIRGKNDNYNEIKNNKDDYLVYTKWSKKNTSYQQLVPYVNLEGTAIESVNEDIDLFLKDFIDQRRCTIIYEYDISGIIFSLVIKVVDYEVEYAPEVYFRTYNVNLETNEVISNEALMEFFGADEVLVESKIESQFMYYYNDLVSEGYFHQEECPYNTFLKFRGVTNYLDNVNYFVKDGDLVVYKPFVYTSIYDEEDYFEEDDFIFLIVESEKN